MSQREKHSPLTTFLQEEMALTLTDNVVDAVTRLPSVTRLRLLAFLHLVERPQTMHAELDFEPSGQLRLTLLANQHPDQGKKH